jgi:hypothetical protein
MNAKYNLFITGVDHFTDRSLHRQMTSPTDDYRQRLNRQRLNRQKIFLQ